MLRLKTFQQFEASQDVSNDLDLAEQTLAQVQSEQAGVNSPEGYRPPLSDTFGRISLENHETSYVGSAHWTSILDGIAELKDHFDDDTKGHSRTDQETDTGQLASTERPILLFGSTKDTTKEEVLSAIPPRPVVDRLISSYFNAMDMAPVIIHGPTFLKEYEKFWENPMVMPVMWVGMLYAMMCLATQFQSFLVDPKGPDLGPQSPQEVQRLVQRYQEKIAQCLVLGKYTKSVPYTIQTLLLYFTTEHFQSEDTQIGTWILLGMVVRIAMRMGYHRDASHSSQFSPFQGEMRRRAWAILVQLDLVASTQIGLPRMIKESQSDAAEPRNLLDADFDEDVVSLPASRSDKDLTPMLYVIVKNRIMTVFGMISDLTTSTRPISYTEVMKLNKILDEAREAIPTDLKMRPIAKSILDNPDVIMQRIYLALIFNKAQCILHRKYLTAAYSNNQYSYSYQTCIGAALQMLKIQSTLNQETQPGGRLYQDKWKVSSLVNHDFLLATTILCLDRDRDIVMQPSTQLVNSAEIKEQREEIMQALHESYRIWLQSSCSSREARKAAEALKIVLGKENDERMSTVDAQVSTIIANSSMHFITDQVPLSHSSPLTNTNHQFSSPFPSTVSMPPYSSTIGDSNFDSTAGIFDWVRRSFFAVLDTRAKTCLGSLGFTIPKIGF